ncbi:MAG: hypothetical protein Tsb0020_39730 [Haliangiales bacterium]
MSSQTTSKWLGLLTLVHDAVEHGSRAVEGLQKQAAQKPLALLARVPGLDLPVHTVEHVFESSVTAIHSAVRGVNYVVKRSTEAAFEAALAASREVASPDPSVPDPRSPPPPERPAVHADVER